jgi:DNA polymerase elongation subunit (family B)
MTKNFYSNVHLSGDKIFYIGYENSERVQYQEIFSPVLFVPSNKETEYKTLEGKYVQPVNFESVRDARNFIDKYKEVEGFTVYGNDRFLYQYISSKFPDAELDYDISKLKIYTIDIETSSENGFPSILDTTEEILCLTIKDFTSKKLIVWGTREYQNTRSDVEYRVFWKESEMLIDFLSWWADNTPDVLTGWNVKLFDVPYICRRIDRILSTKYMKSLSPWNKVNEREVEIKGRNRIYYDIIGVSVLDYLDLYQKFTYTNQESYRLDHIASVELDEQKLDHSEFETFRDFYTQNWQKFVDYNIHDVELVDRMEDKMKLIELAITMAYDAKVNFEDVYYQVRMWDSIIYNYLNKDNIVIPPNVRHEKDSKYAGAYVKEPIPGMYDWVVSFDLNSLYPHLIMQYNISPETLLPHRHPSATVDKILNKELNLSDLVGQTVCANGAFFDTTKQGFLPKLMEKIYTERTVYKKKMLAAKQEYEKNPDPELVKEISRCNNIQMARKIQLNSAYGAIGNQYFRYYKLANAEAITLSGQVSIRWIENKMNGYLNDLLKTEDNDYVIASDTDSIYLNLGPLVNKFFSNKLDDKKAIVSILDKICKDKLEPFIDESYSELARYVSAFDQKMQMKRENIADKGIWTAKKRYILNVWDSEGVRYSEPKLKMMGIEAVKSSTPAPCRTKIKEALKIIMTKTESDLIAFIDQFKSDFFEMPPEEISFPRSVNGLTKWKDPVTLYKKSCPIHVRGALLYNFQITKNKLTHKYPLIQEGEKIKFVYLQTPNILGENVVSFISNFPQEIKISKNIDYKLQFQKSFLDPLKIILDVIGWKTEKEVNLEFLFV